VLRGGVAQSNTIRLVRLRHRLFRLGSTAVLISVHSVEGVNANLQCRLRRVTSIQGLSKVAQNDMVWGAGSTRSAPT